MTIQLPKFNFANSSIKTTDEVTKELDALKGDGGKYFRPGKYEVTITKVEYQGPASDDNWGKFLVTLRGAGDKEITDQIIVPLRDVMYRTRKGEKTILMFKKFSTFMAALGVTLTVENLGETMTEYFTNPSKSLSGRTVSVDIGYKGNHASYIGKNAAGAPQYNLTMRDGSVLADKNGVALVFDGIEAALAHAEANQIEVTRYVDVLSYSVSASGAKAPAANW